MFVWFTHLCGPASSPQQVLLWSRVVVGTVCVRPVYLNNSSLGLCVCTCVCVCARVGQFGLSALRDDIIRVLIEMLPTHCSE